MDFEYNRLPSIESGVYSNTPSPNKSGTQEIGAEQALRSQVSCIKKWLKCLWPPFLPHFLHTPSLHLGPHGKFPKVKTEKTRLRSGLQWFYTARRHHPEVDSYNSTAPFWDIP